MIRPIELTASTRPAAGIMGGGAGVAGAASGTAARTSSARISPPGPEPRTLLMSTSRSRAMRLALGETLTLAVVPGLGAAGVSTTALAVGLLSVRRPVSVGPESAGGASPGCTSHAMACPTGTTSPSRALMPARIPLPSASISTTALSVSTSRSSSPLVTCSPSFLRQETNLPVSCAISSAGMTTLTAISSRPQPFPPARWRRSSRRLHGSGRARLRAWWTAGR